MRIIRFYDLHTQLWKNGGGSTREIAAFRSNQDTIWRISMADVETEGPFSVFSGLTRILTVVKGKGICLKHAGGTIDALFGVPVLFDGALPIRSKLMDGPISDLNLMFDAKMCRGEVTMLQTPTKLASHNVTAVFGLTGNCLVNSTCDLQFGDTALLENESAEIRLSTDGSALIVSLNLIHQ